VAGEGDFIGVFSPFFKYILAICGLVSCRYLRYRVCLTRPLHAMADQRRLTLIVLDVGGTFVRCCCDFADVLRRYSDGKKGR
jgi:hypothetical protein